MEKFRNSFSMKKCGDYFIMCQKCELYLLFCLSSLNFWFNDNELWIRAVGCFKNLGMQVIIQGLLNERVLLLFLPKSGGTFAPWSPWVPLHPPLGVEMDFTQTFQASTKYSKAPIIRTEHWAVLAVHSMYCWTGIRTGTYTLLQKYTQFCLFMM